LAEQKRKSDAQRREAEAKKVADAKKRKEQEIKDKQLREQAEKQKAQREAEEQKRRQLEREFEQALQEEEGMLLEEQYATTAQSYAALIQQRVVNNWSRPPSARNGMRCELTISMVPNGRVVDVVLARSSGNPAFDRSAIAAVKKVETFPEVKDIPIEVFERHFRKFSLGFQPEDLRQ
jgi:Cell division and transport-associated protein TolA (TC 2.C.1.2.1)